ncbi:hypothetical protein DM01DRAFT_1099879 [Hesseltinella vesiculosa]|uniref:Uncharacterized protein n=1 Tax=Hesseltinella vesiculosa TaxID=101127 RepID=A0A1X2GC07_9FUNG|nr:hypothetical protein DM01DRAFT_1099879 [Hesseltinella vesiculosa]
MNAELKSYIKNAIEENLREFKLDLKRELQNTIDAHLEILKQEFVSKSELHTVIRTEPAAPAAPAKRTGDQEESVISRKRVKEAVNIAIATIEMGNAVKWDLNKPLNHPTNVAFKNQVWESVQNGAHAAVFKENKLAAFDCLNEIVKQKFHYQHRLVDNPPTPQETFKRADQRRRQGLRKK